MDPSGSGGLQREEGMLMPGDTAGAKEKRKNITKKQQTLQVEQRSCFFW